MRRTVLALSVMLAAHAGLSTTLCAQQLEAWVIDGESERPYFPKLQEAFNNKFKDQGISVKLTPIPSYNETMRSAFTTGGLPDIIMVDGPDMSNYVWSGQLAPLDTYLDDALKQDLLPAIKDQGTYPPDGKIYMVSPYDSTVIIWANKTYLEKAGIRIPKTVEDAWTMEEFEDAMAKLAKVEGVQWPLDLKLNYTGEWLTYGFSPLIQDSGEDILNRETYEAGGTLDSDASAEALAHVQKWVKNGWVVPATAGENRFYGDKSAAMVWVGNWMWPAHREGLGDKLIQIPAPKFGSKRHVSPNGGWGWSLPAGGKNKEAAGKFINFAMSPEMVALWADTTGYVPSRGAAMPLSKLFKEGGEGELMAKQAETIALIRVKHPAYPMISKTFGEAVKSVIGGADPKTELKKAAAAIDEDIEDNDGYPPFGKE